MCFKVLICVFYMEYADVLIHVVSPNKAITVLQYFIDP